MTRNPNSESKPSDPEGLLRLRRVEDAHLICDALRARTRTDDRPGRHNLTYVSEKTLPTEQVPAPHYTYVLGPYARQEPIAGISFAFVRTLTAYYDYVGEHPYPDEPTPRRPAPLYNDTFIELVFESGERDSYLLNTAAIAKYGNGTTDLMRNPDFDVTGDLFMFVGDEAQQTDDLEGRPRLTPELFFELMDKYARLEQDTGQSTT